MRVFPRARRTPHRVGAASALVAVLAAATATPVVPADASAGASAGVSAGVRAGSAASTVRAVATRPARPTVLADCQHHQVRPREVIIACGDGALVIRIRTYRYWHAQEAVGRGAVLANDCDPSCAAGTFHRTPARVRLFRPVMTAAGPVFSRLAVRYHHHGKPGRDAYWLPTEPLTP